MKTYETTATVEKRGDVRVEGVPFAPGTEVEVMIAVKRRSAIEFREAWNRVCTEMRLRHGADDLTDEDIAAEIDRFRKTS